MIDHQLLHHQLILRHAGQAARELRHTLLQCRLRYGIQSNAWRFNLAASYNEIEFDQVEPGTGFIEGERVPGSPKTNASAGVQYDFALGAEWSGFARADYQYVGEIRLLFGQGPARQVVDQDAYGTGNVRLGVSRGNLALEIFGHNVTDKRAVTSTGNPNPIFGGDQIIIRPREVGLEVRYSYR